MVPNNVVTPESEAELSRLRQMAESLGLRFTDVVRAGSQGSVIGMQSKELLFSQRLDSRTFFVQDSRFGADVLEAADKDYLRAAHEVVEKLKLPTGEIAASTMVKEQNQTAEVDPAGAVKMGERERGKAWARLARQIDGIPIWSSRVFLGLKKDRSIGFLEAHWPEIPATIIDEAKRLAAKVKEGWQAPEHPGSKPVSIEAGVIHSPALGFMMDIYPVIRVIYEPTDPRLNKRPVLYFDRHGNPAPRPRQFDVEPEAAPGKRPSGLGSVSNHRKRFRELLLSNPNYFGNIKGSTFPPQINLQLDTAFEELGCIGYNPDFSKLEAVVYIKQNSGYGGGLCSSGSQEFVRFYLSYDNGTSWQDQGMTSFTAYDVAFEGRLEYAVTLNINPPEKFCFIENLPLVRAILSWNDPPPANTPDFPPVWGNVKEAHIQIQGFEIILLEKLLAESKVKLLPSIEPLINLKQEISLTKKQPLTARQKFELYKGKQVPPHRFLQNEIKSFTAQPWVVKPEPAAFAGISIAGNLNLGSIIGQLFDTNGDTSYEELTCIGLDPNESRLNGVIKVKLSSGYSGPLCSPGSQEFVAFWIDYGGGWTYAGTTSVTVHDISGIPADGLYYSVFLPVDLVAHPKPCNQGPVQPRVRAILSWDFIPPSGDPDFIPTWGNRIETLIEIPSGETVDGQVPLLSSVGDMFYTKINGVGKANGNTTHTGLVCSDSPFGGVIVFGGHISNPAPGLKYRLMRSIHGLNAWTPLTNEPAGLDLDVNIWTGVWTSSSITVHSDSEGYYPFEDYSWDHNVEGNIMMRWYSTLADDDVTYDFRIDLSSDGNPLDDVHSNIVTVLIDNTPPDASLLIDLGVGVQCADFAPGATFTGTFTGTDPHFGGFWFELEPSGPPNNPTHGVLPSPASGASMFFGGGIADPGVGAGTYTLNTTGMDPCGYALILHVYDRTNVNSGGSYNYTQRSVGFCLQTSLKP
jgi:hypothetical protein